MEEEDDDGTVLQGSWIRRHGYVTECDIDARWILYYPNDHKPQGSLRIVSHPDLPPGHLRSFVSIVTKRWPKTSAELAKTLENYGIVTEDELFFHNGNFYKNKIDITYYVYNNCFYKNKSYDKVGDKIIIKYLDPTTQNEILKPNTINKTESFADEFRVTTYSTQLSKAEFESMFKSVVSELDAYNIFENVQTWDTETMDKMRNLEKLYNVKIFE
jgi:hypothetical protein